MQAPQRIEPRGLADYLEAMTKAVFQSGISWKVVEAKWPGIREAFQGFDAEAIARFTPDDVDRLTADSRVIRNRRKLEATIENARQILDLEKQHGSFRNYLRSHAGFEATVADLRRRFRFLGDLGAYHFLWVVKEQVPPYELWCASRGRTPHSMAR
jgi:3-methyladenine DNA glycosylase Tag